MAAPRFVVKVYEVLPAGCGDRPWAVLVVPGGAAPATAKDGHSFFRVSFPAPVCLPAKGLVRILGAGGDEGAAIYEKGVPAAPPPAGGGGPAGGPAPPGGLPREPDPVEAAFPGWGGLPESLWAQLGPLSDPLVAQVRLRKLPRPHPAGAGGGFYAYGADTLVVHAAGPGAAADRKKALDI